MRDRFERTSFPEPCMCGDPECSLCFPANDFDPDYAEEKADFEYHARKDYEAEEREIGDVF